MSQLYLKLCLRDSSLITRLETSLARRFNEEKEEEKEFHEDDSQVEYPSLLAAIVHEVDDSLLLARKKSQNNCKRNRRSIEEVEQDFLLNWLFEQISVEVNVCLQDCDLSLEDSLNKCKELNQLKQDLQSAFKIHLHS